MSTKKAILCILDGWGIAPPGPGNAITLANPQIYQHLIDHYPNTQLSASGPSVGLPEGENGNSETGHLNIGAGRIVFQDLATINMSIADGSFFTNKALLDSIRHLRSFKSDLHLLGLIGTSGVHAYNEHLFSLLLFAKRHHLKNVYIHLITDGRDSPPDNALEQIQNLENKIKEIGVGEIASIMGRYYAMDRDQRLNRTQKAFDCLVNLNPPTTKTPQYFIKQNYQNNLYDEFLLPTAVEKNAHKSRIKPGDVVIFYNFRTDRPRQLTELFLRSEIPNLRFVTMTKFRSDFQNPVIYTSPHVDNTLGEVISHHKFNQLRVAETEKIAMVTYFFNGQSEIPFPGESHVFVSSPKVATYDQMPEMSTQELISQFQKNYQTGEYILSVINIACPDMVGHTGLIEPTKKAILAADEALGVLQQVAKDTNSYLLITADHGNAEELINLDNNKVNTEHSHYPVPLIIYHPTDNQFKLSKGKLGDIAPTILDILELPKPDNMTGNSLIVR